MASLGCFFSYEVLLWYVYQFPPELLENASTNFLLCRGGLEGLKRSHPDFSRLLPIPQYISNTRQAMIPSALATAGRSRWILCKDFCSVQTIYVRGKKEGRGKQASSLPPPLMIISLMITLKTWRKIHNKLGILWNETWSTIGKKFPSSSGVPKCHRHCVWWTKALIYSDKSLCNRCKAQQRLDEYLGIFEIFWSLLV